LKLQVGQLAGGDGRPTSVAMQQLDQCVQLAHAEYAFSNMEKMLDKQDPFPHQLKR
jgi:hypothetical protein